MTKEERQARRKELMKQYTALSPEQRAEIAAKMGVVTIEGRSLSMTNQVLLAFQLPSATIVGGFRQWKKAGRFVCKGQHGAAIWIPLGLKKGKDGPEDDELGQPSGFILGTVFDISQTEKAEERAA